MPGLRVSDGLRRMALLAAVGVFAAGCGGSPTEGGGEPDAGSGGSGDLASVTADLADVTDLGQRREKLIELAKDEGGSVTWYTAFNEDDVAALAEDFESETGIKIEVYRAGSSTVRQRTEQEADGGGIRADLVSVTGSDPGILAEEGHYEDLESPVLDQLIPEAVFPTWFGDQVYVFAPAWNAKAIPQGQGPEDYVDMLENFTDKMVIEQTDADWLFGMVAYLEQEKGMSEDEALDLVGGAVKKSTPFDGHTSMTELVAAGQFNISPDNYHYRVLETIDASPTMAWDPAIGPLLSEFGGTGVAKGAAHPAAALLLAEYLMVDNQKTTWVDSQRTPTLQSAKADGVGAYSDPESSLFFIDYGELIPNITRYQKLFTDMLGQTGS
jgi:iron(III) transport system substrate-binding protein